MNATRVAVTDVPMLQPIMMGIAWVTLREFGPPEPTSPTTSEVDVDELCLKKKKKKTEQQ